MGRKHRGSKPRPRSFLHLEPVPPPTFTLEARGVRETYVVVPGAEAVSYDGEPVPGEAVAALHERAVERNGRGN